MRIADPSIPGLLALVLIGFGAGTAGALLAASRPRLARLVTHMFALFGGFATLSLGLAGLAGGTMELHLPQFLPVGGVALGLDRLSAFFVLVIGAGAIPAALYGLGYTRHYEGKHSLAAMGAALNLFLAAMVLVVLARNVLTFLLLWEAMSLASYFLVMTEHEHRETERAGWVYLVMTHLGFACLLTGFLIMAGITGSMSFDVWGSFSNSGPARHVVFVLLAVGFGSKAGLIPLHIWLPRAHPAAPSHVSALMSGVMIKLGIYGLVRVGFDWFAVDSAWWGGAILIAGSVSAVLGVLYAIIESDLKRLLAYSSVENVGLILLGVGAGMLFRAYHLPGLAGLALVAALCHVLNHSVFKGLLFMVAGAILDATGTRNMEEMGGLIKRMPQTAVLFLVGSISIAALPPFNGFIGEWLTFQSLLLSFNISAGEINLVFVLALASLSLTSGLAAACFIRAFGISFLALPRSEPTANAREVGLLMRLGMAIPAIACLLLGIAPFALLSRLNGIVFELTGVTADLRPGWSAIVANDSFASVSPLWIGIASLALLAAIITGLRIIGANSQKRYYETWGCGRALQTARFEYTATAFANPFKRVFGLLYRPVKELDIRFHPESRFFIGTIAYRNAARSIFEEALYDPLARLGQSIAERARILQSGNVHVYLLYILIALIVLLILAR